jgi:GntR family transcriptional regulator, rspAB operon transcriptional repressor
VAAAALLYPIVTPARDNESRESDKQPRLDTVRPSKAQEIHAALREQIVSGLLAPGRRIVQENIAAEFNVSRIPAREALHLLAAEGLITIEPDVGARVAPLNPEELREVYLMREALEPITVAASVPFLTAEDLERLGQLVDEGDALAAEGDIAGYLRMDAEFHDLMSVRSGLPRIHREIHRLREANRQFRGVYSLLPASLPQSNIEHRNLVEACERLAAQDAADLHRIHTRRTRLTLDNHPEWLTATATGSQKIGAR